MWSTISADKDHIMGDEALQHFLFCQNIQMVNAKLVFFSATATREKRSFAAKKARVGLGQQRSCT